MPHCKFPLFAALVTGLLPLAATPLQAADDAGLNAAISHLEHEWARISYQLTDSSDQLRQIDALAKEADAVVKRYPARAEPLVWDGIITSEEAGMASPFTALGYAKAARALFEKAGQIDAKVLKGAVPMSLGTLYYRVPGFPIGFGDDAKARQFLQQALAMDPDGLDANYFYGDFLIEQGQYEMAHRALAHGLNAPVDPDRPVWDSGRRREIRALLVKIDKKMASAH